MKKAWACLLAGVMVFSMAACGSNEETTAAPTTEAETTEAATEAASSEAEDTTAAGDTTEAAAGETQDWSHVTTVSEGKLIVATEAGFAPYEYLSGDQVVGVDMDIAQAIADELGLELEIMNMDFTGALLAVQQGKADIVAAGVSVDAERAEVMDFSVNYVDSTEVVVVNAENPAVTEPTGEALNGKNVGVQQGNIADLWVSDTENTTPGEITRYTTFAQAAQDLMNGKIDCIVMDELPAQELVASNSALTILEGDPLFVDQYAIGMAKGNTAMKEAVDYVITSLQESGEMDEIMARHISAE